jgi:DNA-binding MarR family transcriptional regulator
MKSSKTDLLTGTVLAVFRANGRLIAWGDKFVAPFGLTSARWQMLGALALSKQPLTAPQLADNMGVSRQGAQKQLNLLVAENFVSQLPNPYHKRSPYYELTKSGSEVYTAIEQKWIAHIKKLCARIEMDDILTANRILALLIDKHATEPNGDVQ